MSANVLFVFGLGFSARILALRLLAEGWTVRGTTRSAEKAGTLRADGIDAYLFDSVTPLFDSGVLDGWLSLYDGCLRRPRWGLG